MLDNETDKRLEAIERLQDRVVCGEIKTLKELCHECDKYKFGIEPFEDVLMPIEWNICDKCGALGDSDGDFLWCEGLEFDELDEAEKYLEKVIGEAWKRGDYWSALCWKCVNDIKSERRESWHY